MAVLGDAFNYISILFYELNVSAPADPDQVDPRLDPFTQQEVEHFNWLIEPTSILKQSRIEIRFGFESLMID